MQSIPSKLHMTKEIINSLQIKEGKSYFMLLVIAKLQKMNLYD